MSCVPRTDVPKSDEVQGSLPKSLAGKTILFVYGGWEGHHPEACRDLYVPWMRQQGAAIIVSNSLDIYTDTLVMQSADLIVQIWTMGEITEPQLQGLLAAVRSGTGIAGWHGGLGDAFRNAPEYQFMIGGQWVAHPGGIIDYSITIADHDDPVTRDITDFSVHTEQYYMHVDPNVHVLATTTFNGDHADWIDGYTMPVTWKTRYGKGRVFYNAIGHRMEDHAVPEFETMMKRGMLWACR
jgi:type 1 glutamine amidotransferase